MPVNYAEITANLSASRLRTYRTGLTTSQSGLPTSETVKAYFLLNEVSQHFFVPLQLVEVVLRNRINDHVKNCKGKANWYDSVPATVKAKDQVIKAKDLTKEEVKNPTPDDVVCRLTFGFWVNMLDGSQRDAAKPDHYIWDQYGFKRVFPGASTGVSIGLVSNRLLTLNTLRNRLFHHEPIWKGNKVDSVESAMKRIKARYADLIEVLGWLSPEKQALLHAWSFPGRFALSCEADRFDRKLW